MVYLLIKKQPDRTNMVQFRPTVSDDLLDDNDRYASLVYIPGVDAKVAALTISDNGLLNITIESGIDNYMTKEAARLAWNALIKGDWVRAYDLEKIWKVHLPRDGRVVRGGTIG